MVWSLVLFLFVVRPCLCTTLFQPECRSILAVFNETVAGECMESWRRGEIQPSYGAHPSCERSFEYIGSEDIGFDDLGYINSSVKYLCARGSPYLRTDQHTCLTATKEVIRILLDDGVNPKALCTLLSSPIHPRSLVQHGPLQSRVNVVTCELCVLLTKRIKRLLSDESVKRAVESTLSSVCRYLGKYEKQCKEIVHIDMAAFFDLMAHDLDADSLCQFVHFCERVNPPLCPLCKYLMDQVKARLQSNSTIERVEAALQHVCARLGNWNDLCDEILKKDVPKVMNWLTNQMNSNVICYELSACPRPWKIDMMVESAMDRKTDTLESPVGCSMCKSAVEMLKTLVTQNGTIEKLENVIYELCEMTGKHSSQCKAYVKEYLPLIIKLLKNGLDAKTVCQNIGLCERPEAPPVVKDTRKRSRLGCSVCKSIVEALTVLVAQNKSIEEMEHLMNKLCDLTGKYADICKQYIKEYLPRMIELLEKKLDAQTVCETIGLCKPTRGPENIQPCPLCIRILRTLKNETGPYPSFASTSRAVTRVCSTTGKLMTDCLRIVDGNERAIAMGLARYENETAICKSIHICPPHYTEDPEEATEVDDKESAAMKRCAQIFMEESWSETSPVTPSEKSAEHDADPLTKTDGTVDPLLFYPGKQ